MPQRMVSAIIRSGHTQRCRLLTRGFLPSAVALFFACAWAPPCGSTDRSTVRLAIHAVPTATTWPATLTFSGTSGNGESAETMVYPLPEGFFADNQTNLIINQGVATGFVDRYSRGKNLVFIPSNGRLASDYEVSVPGSIKVDYTEVEKKKNLLVHFPRDFIHPYFSQTAAPVRLLRPEWLEVSIDRAKIVGYTPRLNRDSGSENASSFCIPFSDLDQSGGELSVLVGEKHTLIDFTVVVIPLTIIPLALLLLPREKQRLQNRPKTYLLLGSTAFIFSVVLFFAINGWSTQGLLSFSSNVLYSVAGVSVITCVNVLVIVKHDQSSGEG